MGLISLDSVILQSFAYSETSKILRLLTRTHGVRSVIAKGALRPRSRYGGILEPFTDGVATLYLKEGRDLQTLSGFELRRSRQGLGRHLVRFGGASLLGELILRTASEEAHPELFDAFRRGLDALDRAADTELEAAVLAEAWHLIGHLGFAPALDSCLGCGREVEPAEATTFDHAAGGIRCPECAPSSPGRPLPPHAREALVRLGRRERVPLDRTAAHWQLLRRFLLHHVIEGRELRSLEFLEAALTAA